MLSPYSVASRARGVEVSQLIPDKATSSATLGGHVASSRGVAPPGSPSTSPEGPWTPTGTPRRVEPHRAPEHQSSERVLKERRARSCFAIAATTRQRALDGQTTSPHNAPTEPQTALSKRDRGQTPDATCSRRSGPVTPSRRLATAATRDGAQPQVRRGTRARVGSRTRAKPAFATKPTARCVAEHHSSGFVSVVRRPPLLGTPRARRGGRGGAVRRRRRAFCVHKSRLFSTRPRHDERQARRWRGAAGDASIELAAKFRFFRHRWKSWRIWWQTGFF